MIPFVQHEDFLPFSVLVKLASANNFSNSFLLFELCRICGELQKREVLEPDMLHVTSVTLLPLLTAYLANYLDDQCRLGQRVLLPDDYLSASLRCLWYLQTPSWHVLLLSSFGLPLIFPKRHPFFPQRTVLFPPVSLTNLWHSKLFRGYIQQPHTRCTRHSSHTSTPSHAI